MSTASIIIIGDEILANKFVDENTPYLLKKCAELNLQVQSVQIIPDTLERIAQTVSEESKRSTYVFTTGGVGPTHDDKTFEGVGRAFHSPLFRHPDLVALLEKYSSPITDAAYRMAEVPEETELIPTTRGFPQIKVRNVFVFPGIPKLLQLKFEVIEHLLVGRKKFHAKVYLTTEETHIATQLGNLQNEHPHVQLGSYPRMNEQPSLILTIEGFDEEKVQNMKETMEELFQAFLHRPSYF